MKKGDLVTPSQTWLRSVPAHLGRVGIVASETADGHVMVRWLWCDDTTRYDVSSLTVITKRDAMLRVTLAVAALPANTFGVVPIES